MSPDLLSTLGSVEKYCNAVSACAFLIGMLSDGRSHA